MPNSSDSPDISTQVVEELFQILRIDEFLENNKSLIYPKLEHYDYLVELTKAKDNLKGPGVLIFISASLPLIKGVIHLGTNPENFNRAIEWIKNQLPWVNPEPILVGLIFLRIVEKWGAFYGTERNETTEYKFPSGNITIKKQEIWERIHKRVTLLVN